MSEDVSMPNVDAPRRSAILLAATVALWAHYGTAIFFETIRAGLVACFG